MGTQCHGIKRDGDRCTLPATDGAFCRHHPLSGGLVTKSGFADLQGVTPPAVTKWLKGGVIEETICGLIRWQKAQRSVDQNRKISRTKRRNGTQSIDLRVGDDELSADEISYLDKLYRMREKREKALMAEMERREAEGLLVDGEEVENAAFEEGRNLQIKLMSIPDRLSAELVGMTDQAEIRTLLTDEIRGCLTELAQEPVDGISEDSDAA